MSKSSKRDQFYCLLEAITCRKCLKCNAEPGWMCAATENMSQQLGNEVERQSKANKSTTLRTAQRKEEELPWVGFETTTLCSLGERSTN